MPLTPFHWGPSSWIGLLLFKILDFPTLLIASVIVDIEPFCVLFLNLNYPLHGFFHSFLGGSILAVLAAIILYLLKGKIKKIMAIFKIPQDSSFKKILWTSFFGVYFHLLLDSFLYKEMNPFYPLENNPFFGLFSLQQIYLFCALSFLVGILFYSIKLGIFKREKD
ncbi:MAG: metal-dependent hydrolase [Candidatus Nealsonbacteria bacterium]